MITSLQSINKLIIQKKNMNIIGINYLSESSVCYLKNGKLINAISEERINRIKNWYGIPHKSIKTILKKII